MAGDAGRSGQGPIARRRPAPRSILIAVVGIVLLLGGGAALTVGLLSQQSAPNPAASAPAPSPTRSPAPTSSSPSADPSTVVGSPGSGSANTAPPATVSDIPTATAQASPPPEPAAAAPAASPPAAARPIHLRIPAIEVDTELIELGLAPDGSLAVPAPGPDYDKAAWFNGSPAPGDVGPAVLEGHIDSAANGPSVFFELAALTAGDQVFVDRADGSTVSFTVDTVASYPKSDFPTLQVYRNTSGPELRLITCGGDFDSGAGSYLNNTVVYAHQNEG
ncbi:MAG TPA: class F sortase [Nakamurella multipartita]|nr:class F sortase [Nakamurella multipartita]